MPAFSKRVIGTVAAVALTSTLALGAPLFPDVQADHWARDAVAALAARGLLEGYPDGTFKGDRAASRWEVALVVARLLARMEQAHSTFATRAELEEVRRLVESLRGELDALGVRAGNLEEGTARLDQRVTELERITFYGAVDTRVVSQRFHSTGQPSNDATHNGLGKGPVPFVDYHNLVGNTAGSILRPQTSGSIPVEDYTVGRSLINGTGFTMKGTLGLKLKLSDDIDAGVEFASFTAEGNQFVNAYWGISAPYLSNPSVADNILDGSSEGLNNQPFTKMTLDHAWFEHKPSKTRLVLGYYDHVRLDPLVYAGMFNLNAFGPKRLVGFGFDLTGEQDFNETDRFLWETMASRWGEGNIYQLDDYQHLVLGGDVSYQFGKVPSGGHDSAGEVKFNFVRQTDEASGGGPFVVGLVIGSVPYGATTGYTPIQWVNPAGYFANQTPSKAPPPVNGVFRPNTIDTRPIPGWNPTVDNAIGLTLGGGNFGPQDQTTFGLSSHYDWDLDEDTGLRVRGEYAHSDYRSNRNSSFSRPGQALRFEFGSSLLAGDLDLALFYLSVDPTYDPFMNIGNFIGTPQVRPFNFTARNYLHDFQTYPHNRQGFQFKGRWRFDERHGEVSAYVDILHQTQTSLYDVRVPASALGLGTPTNDVLGFSPGFTDPVFAGFASRNLYGPASANAFSKTLQPLENPRGTQNNYGLSVWYRWDDPGLRLDVTYQHNQWFRPTSLAPAQGGSQNYMNLGTSYGLVGLTWNADDTYTLRGGAEFVRAGGHFDPGGLYNPFANTRGSTSFTNLDSLQTVPYVGLDVTVNPTTTWSTNLRYVNTTDQIGNGLFAGQPPAGRGLTTHPFSWAGLQATAEFHVKF